MTEELTTLSSELKQSTNYFEGVPFWRTDASKLRFEVKADDISGRIPVTRLESWRDFTALLEDRFFNRSGIQYVYRGHRRFDWGLTPTLGRLTENEIVTKELAEEQLAMFRRAIRGRIEDRALLESDGDARQSDELWAVGQHHGLRTPLIDWTYSPYVALFFAFAEADVKGETDNPYRVVYLLNKTFVEDSDLCPDIRVLEPRKDDFGRLVNQAGLFTFSPFDATIENKLSDILSDPEFSDDALRSAAEDKQAEILASYICKIYIRNDDRDGCLRHLRRMNVHHASLFPDLIGAANYCNILAEEDAKERLLLKHATITEPTQVKTFDASVVEKTSAVDAVEATVVRAKGFEGILKAPIEAAQVEPGRLKAIAEELRVSLTHEKAVDWKDRESVQARLRVVAKVTLRKYGYPATIRDTVAERLVIAMVSEG